MFNKFKVDFLGIILGLEKIYVFYFIYKVFVEVNEKGIEVVVVIVVGIMGMGFVLKKFVFCVDYLFLFIICYKKLNVILFMGCMLKLLLNIS